MTASFAGVAQSEAEHGYERAVDRLVKAAKGNVGALTDAAHKLAGRAVAPSASTCSIGACRGSPVSVRSALSRPELIPVSD